MSNLIATILNVNDDEATRYTTSRILKHAGFGVIEAATGMEALRLVAKLPDLVVLDVKLPDVIGYDVCEQIKANAPTAQIPVLLLSASFLQSSDKVAGLQKGADGYLTNPVEPQELIATIQALLRMRRAEDSARLSAMEWEATFQAISDAVCMVDNEGVILRCNNAMADLLGQTPQKLQGASYLSIAPPPLADISRRQIDSSENGRSIGEFLYQSKWLRVTSNPVFDEQEKIIATVYVLTDTTDLKAAEQENAGLLAKVQASAAIQRTFLREVLAGITDGHFLLCDSSVDLPIRLNQVGERITLTRENLHQLRQAVEQVAVKHGLPDKRWQDLITGVSEASMNAVVHGGGGTAQVCVGEQGRIQVWIEDSGAGIAIDNIPKAALKRGYTTAGTLGHGFWLMLKAVDRIYLLTGDSGTTVVLEQDRVAPEPMWFEAYPALS